MYKNNKSKKKTKEELKNLDKKKEKTISRLLGMKDSVGNDSKYYYSLLDKIRKFSKFQGFSSIKAPFLESYDLYKKLINKNQLKDLYLIEGDKSEKSTLRPEMTPGIIRAYLENSLFENNLPLRLFSLGQVFHHNKLQTGYYRESTQANWDIIGEDDPLAEALLIAFAYNLFNELGIKVQVQINSIGSNDCRREYCNKLTSFYKERGRKSKLCRYCKADLGKNCLSILNCKNESCIKSLEEAPQIVDYLSEESREHFTKTLEFLDELDINYNFNPYLVPDSNYYNDTFFEFWPLNEQGVANNRLVLGRGGRYDSLVESMGGNNTSAFGFYLNLERVLSRIKDKENLLNNFEEGIVFIAQLGKQAKIKAFQLFIDLRQAGFKVRQSFASNSLKKQLEEAIAIQAKTSLILGKKEIMDETILIRDMDSGAQETVVFKKIKEYLVKKDKIIKKKINNRKVGGLYGRL